MPLQWFLLLDVNSQVSAVFLLQHNQDKMLAFTKNYIKTGIFKRFCCFMNFMHPRVLANQIYSSLTNDERLRLNQQTNIIENKLIVFQWEFCGEVCGVKCVSGIKSIQWQYWRRFS